MFRFDTETAAQVAKHAEIAGHYQRLKRKKSKLGGAAITTVRIDELRDLFQGRYPGCQYPQTKQSENALFAICVHKWLSYREGEPAVRQHIAAWAPWLNSDTDKRESFIGRVKRMNYPHRAEKLGRILGLTKAERDKYGITTFRPIDETPTQHKAAKRSRKRRRRGTIPRAEYRASVAAGSLKQTEPWKAEGISRAAWYRRRKTGVEPSLHAPLRLGVSPTILSFGIACENQVSETCREFSARVVLRARV